MTHINAALSVKLEAFNTGIAQRAWWQVVLEPPGRVLALCLTQSAAEGERNRLAASGIDYVAGEVTYHV